VLRRHSRSRWALRLAPVLGLAAGNLAVFWRHYFRDFGFPWDFLGTYYAVVAHWTSAVRHGTFPLWVPFQSMGYPLPINLQSGLFYPAFWVFPAVRAAYSVHAAVVLQCLHVLVGALGVYALARRLGRSRRDAFLAAFAFQLFGGFYSNAEHPDIVRGDALAPWLLWSLTAPPARSRRGASRLLALPAVVFLLATGAYPGIFIASLFLGALWVLFQLLSRTVRLRFVADAAVLALLGLALAAVALAPAWIHRPELARYTGLGELDRIGFVPRQYPSLFLPNACISGNASLNTIFLPLPLLLAALWASPRGREVRAALALLAVSALMAAGPPSPLYRLVRAVAPPLGYSRLPAADYRVFIAIAIAVLGASGLARLRRVKTTGRASAARWIAAAAVVAACAAFFMPRSESRAAALLAASFAAIVALTRLRPRRLTAAAALAGGWTLLMFADSGRVLLHMQHLGGDLWRVPDVSGVSRNWPELPANAFEGDVPETLFSPRPGPRPARRRAPPGYRAAGYLTGDVLLFDYGGTELGARAAIQQDPALLAFMSRPWIGILFFDAPGATSNDVSVPASTLGAEPDSVAVRQTSWGNDSNAYEVRLAKPALLVENEVFFPGWTATLSTGERLRAVRVNGALRAWHLPAGSYSLATIFAMPELTALATVSGAAAVIYAALLAMAALKAARTSRRGTRPSEPGTPSPKDRSSRRRSPR